MLKDITLGQYFPGNTVVHRLDPRTKLLLVVVYIVALFTAEGLPGYLLVFAFLTASFLLSKIHPKVILKGMKPLIVIICLTGLLNLFYTPGQVLAEFWIFTITKEGIFSALYMIWRIVMLILSCATVVMVSRSFGIPIHNSPWAISGWTGVKYYAASFIPVVIFIALVRLMTACTRKSKNSRYYGNVMQCICRPTVIFCMALIFTSRLGLNFVYRYTPDFADAMFFLFRGLGNLCIVGLLGSMMCEIVENW